MMTHESNPQHLSRREMLWRCGSTLGAAGLSVVLGKYLHDRSGKAAVTGEEPATLPNYFSAVDFPIDAPRISIARGGPDNIDATVRAAIGGLDAHHGMGRFVQSGDVVLIKPNVGFERAPTFGATTNPEVIRSVIRLCHESGAKEVLIADNPIEQPAACFARSGIQQVADTEKARVILPSERLFRSVAVRSTPPNSSRHEILDAWPVFYEPLARANKVIGIAPVKDHNLCSASMGLKNWYGLLGGPRNQLHQTIHEAVSDLGLMISPTLVINDGTRVLMRHGPTGGRMEDVKECHTIVAGVDSVAVDAWCYQNLLERDPAQLTYLQYAAEKFGAKPFEESHRFGQPDWTVYQREGKIIETHVG